MSSLFFWLVYFTLDDVDNDDVYKVKAVFIMVLGKTSLQIGVCRIVFKL